MQNEFEMTGNGETSFASFAEQWATNDRTHWEFRGYDRLTIEKIEVNG